MGQTTKEQTQRCIISGCSNLLIDGHHLRRTGRGGRRDEPDEQKIKLCRIHHIEAHQIGPIRFLAKYAILTCTAERYQTLIERGKAKLRMDEDEDKISKTAIACD